MCSVGYMLSSASRIPVTGIGWCIASLHHWHWSPASIDTVAAGVHCITGVSEPPGPSTAQGHLAAVTSIVLDPWRRSIGFTIGFTITEKAPVPTRAFSWLKAFKTILRHYAKWATWALTPESQIHVYLPFLGTRLV